MTTIINKWLPEEEIYLKDLSRLCEQISSKFKHYYEYYKKIQARFKIPAIVISSVTGLTSLGTSTFPQEAQQWIAIGVGAASLFIAILNSIESYMKIGENMSGCLQASISLQKLKESIDLELAVPAEDRNDPGIQFVRDCHSKYEKILELSPNIFKNIKFVRPVFNENTLHLGITKGFTTSNDIEIAEKHFMDIEDQNTVVSPSPTDPPKKPKTIFLS